MTKINILVVEDNDTAFNNYDDWVEGDFNEQNKSIVLSRAKTAKEAIELLNSQEFHGGIIDLNLYQEATNQASGNQVIKEVVEKYRIPVVVASGNTGNLDHNLSPKDSAFFKVFTRDDDTSTIFAPIINVFETGVFNVIGVKGEVEEGLQKVFWEHLAHDVDDWFEWKEDSEKSILRYTLNHLKAYLEKGIHSFHGAEFYIKPPIVDHISSGDMVLDKALAKRYLLLSPACDVTVREEKDGAPQINANTLILCEVVEVTPECFLESGLIKKINKGSFKDVLKRAVQGTDSRMVYLPQYKNIDAGIADFRNISTVKLDEFIKYERLATVSESFFKNIQSSFASYYARQGQPDLDKNTIIDSTVDGVKWEDYN